MKYSKLSFFVWLLLFSFDAKALVLATLPNTLSDTCVEINLTDGTRAYAKITKKTNEKVYFKKCDDLSDKTEYFVLQEKIDNIKTLDKDIKSVLEDDQFEREQQLKRKLNKMKQKRIVALVLTSFLSGIAMFALPLFFLSFLVSAIWGLIEVLSYKGRFEGKGYAIAFFIAASLVALLFIILIIYVS
jgi:ABC-type multidrug transport system fused ATPase/permease subunit